MKKTGLFLAILLTFTAFFRAQTKVSEVELVKNTAVRDIPAFTKLIPEGHEKDYGFNARTEFAEITVGEPYQVVTFYQSDKENKIIPLKSWRVPVVVKGRFVALLTVEMTESGYSGIDFGAKELANWMEIFEKSEVPKANRVLMRSYKTKQDYFACVEKLSDINEKAEVFSAGSLKKLTLAEVFAQLKTAQ